MSRNWSAQQQAVFAWFKSGKLSTQNLVVRARAGTGKTTTIIEATTYAPEQRILLAAFNKKIAEELKVKLTNPNAEAKTLHSLGFGFVTRYWPNVRPDTERAYRLARQAATDAAPDDMISLIVKLASRGKAMLPANIEALADIAQDADIVPDEDWEKDGWTVNRVATLAWKAMELAYTTRDGTIDFDDMIFLPVANGWVKPRYDLVVIDEAQDMNAAQLRLAQGVCEAAGRICVVGDDRQAIYAFRGADSGSIDRLKVQLKAAELGLTVTYRCGSRIVAEAQALVPDYTAAPNAHPGEVMGSKDLPAATLEAVPEMAGPGDFVLSRKNAPLAKVCLRLLRMGKRAKVEGRDMGAGFKSIVKKLKPKSIPDLLKKLTTWEANQSKRARAMAKTEDQAAAKVGEVQDQAETLRVLAEGMAGVRELTARIDELFADEVAGAFVVCSSVHRSKGRETDRVFVLADSLYPGKRNNVEEQNIHYVAVTRAKNTLVWVKGI